MLNRVLNTIVKYWPKKPTNNETGEFILDINGTEIHVWKFYKKCMYLSFPLVLGLQLGEDFIVYNNRINSILNEKNLVPVFSTNKLASLMFDTFVFSTTRSIFWPVTTYGTCKQMFRIIDYKNGDNEQYTPRTIKQDLWRAIDYQTTKTALERCGKSMNPFDILTCVWALAKDKTK